jgi:hypothetical protein
MEPQNYTPDLVWLDQSEINSRSRVRAHVVRERRRRVSWQEKQVMKNLQKRLQGCKVISADATSDALDEQHTVAAGYPELLGGGRRDPFAIYPVESTPDMLELLDHCEP